jgi:hypothetical protein
MATRNIVPRANGEGSIGTSLKRWLSGFFNCININKYLKLDETMDAPSHEEGRVFYDKTQHTLSVYNENEEVTHNLGQEVLVRVYNDTGSDIGDSKAVRIIGANGEGQLTIELSKADTEATGHFLGLTTSTIPDESYGYVTSLGKIHNINTSSFENGEVLYVSATEAGEITNIKPAIAVIIGYVALSASGTDGIIYVCGNELGAVGADMLKSIYDSNDNQIVDKAEALNDGSSGDGNNVTAEEARDHIDDVSNPHSVTAGQVGAYSETEIDNLFQTVYGTSNGETTTTSINYQQKLRVSITPDQSGDFIIRWTVEVTSDAGAKNTFLKIEQNDTTILNEIEHYVDSANSYETEGGFAIVSLTQGNTYNFDLDFRVQTISGNPVSKVRRARISIERIP